MTDPSPRHGRDRRRDQDLPHRRYPRLDRLYRRARRRSRVGFGALIAHEGVEAWGGRVVELRGDEALAVFESGRDALRAAAELQAAFVAETRLDPSVPSYLLG